MWSIVNNITNNSIVTIRRIAAGYGHEPPSVCQTGPVLMSISHCARFLRHLGFDFNNLNSSVLHGSILCPGFAFFVFIIVGMLVFQRYFCNSVVVPGNNFGDSPSSRSVSVSHQLWINFQYTLVHIVPVKSACFVGANQTMYKPQ